MFEDPSALARCIDHTVVRPDATLEQLAEATSASREHRFAALVVCGWMVSRAKTALAGSGVRVGAVIGFPHGTCTTTVKIMEAMEALRNGAEDLDIVMNLGLLRSGKPDLAEIDVKNVVAMTKDAVHKVIIESGALTPDELQEACRIAVRSGATFIKTSTGYGPRGATVEDVKTIRSIIGATCAIKASGGVKDLAAVKALIEAGADRIGTSSGPAIMKEFLDKK